MDGLDVRDLPPHGGGVPSRRQIARVCDDFSLHPPRRRARSIGQAVVRGINFAPAPMKPVLHPLARFDIRIGQPIPCPVYDRAGRLLLARGQVVSDPRALDALVARGLFVSPSGASVGDVTMAALDDEQPDEQQRQPVPEPRGLPPLIDGRLPLRKPRTIPAWRKLRMWSEGGSADDAMTVVLIGVLDGKSVVITAPERDGRLAFVKEGSLFRFRGFSGELVYEFDAPVQKVRFDPFPYVHVGWPRDWQIGKRRLREARRVRTDIPCILYRNGDTGDTGDNGNNGNNGTDIVSGMLTDLSTGGAALQPKEAVRDLPQRVRLAFRLQVAGQQVLFEIEAKPVRLPDSDEPDASIGLSFLGLDDMQRLALHAFVYAQLVRELETPLFAQ